MQGCDRGWMSAVSLSSDEEDDNEEVMEENGCGGIRARISCVAVGKWMRDDHRRKVIIRVG